MERDASSAGVSEIGGLFNTAEIKILICYILSVLGEPVPANLLADVLHYEGIANCFEVADAIDSLCKSGQLATDEKAENTYTITESGKSVSETLRSSLSLVVRERACAAALKMMTRFKNEKETDITVTHENGKPYVTCTAKDHGVPFMSIKLLVADDEQVQYIRERFLNDSELYANIINLITK